LGWLFRKCGDPGQAAEDLPADYRLCRRAEKGTAVHVYPNSLRASVAWACSECRSRTSGVGAQLV